MARRWPFASFRNLSLPEAVVRQTIQRGAHKLPNRVTNGTGKRLRRTIRGEFTGASFGWFAAIHALLIQHACASGNDLLRSVCVATEAWRNQ